VSIKKDNTSAKASSMLYPLKIQGQQKAFSSLILMFKLCDRGSLDAVTLF